jgi:hypothetical protein
MSLHVEAEVAALLHVHYVCSSHIRQNLCHVYVTADVDHDNDTGWAAFAFLAMPEATSSDIAHVDDCRTAAAITSMSFETLARDLEPFLASCRACSFNRVARMKLPSLKGGLSAESLSMLSRLLGAFSATLPVVCQSLRRPRESEDNLRYGQFSMLVRFVPPAELDAIAQRLLKKDAETLESHLFFERQLTTVENELTALVSSTS